MKYLIVTVILLSSLCANAQVPSVPTWWNSTKQNVEYKDNPGDETIGGSIGVQDAFFQGEQAGAWGYILDSTGAIVKYAGSSSITSGYVLKWDGSKFAAAADATGGGGGTVTSVGIASGTTGTDVNITGSPVTTSGTITINIPSASATARGLITTGVQTIAGSKTFSSLTNFQNGVDISGPGSIDGEFTFAATSGSETVIDNNGHISMYAGGLPQDGQLLVGNTGSGIYQVLGPGSDGDLLSTVAGNADWITPSFLSSEVDGSVTNEIQDLSYDAANHEIDISLGGTSAVLPLADDDGATEGLASFDNTNFNADAAGNVTIAADGIAIGTHTTGNYVASVATTSPLTGGAAGSEGAALTISLPITDQRIVFGTGTSVNGDANLLVDITDYTVAIGNTNSENYNMNISDQSGRMEFVATGYGAETQFKTRYANGNQSSPTVVLNNDPLAVFGAAGYDATGGFTSDVDAGMKVIASENWSSTAHGTEIAWATKANGSNTLTKNLKLNATGLRVGGISNPSYPLDVTGDVNISTGSLYRINGTQIAASNLSNGTTGSGAVALATSPTLVTPNIGVATATSVNKVAITAPATSATLTIADGKTFTASNTITETANDGTTLNFKGGESVNAPYTSVYFYDDFMNTSTTETGELGTQGWSFAASGTGAQIATGAFGAARPGIIGAYTGTTTTGSCVITLGSYWCASGGQTTYTVSVRMPTLSTAAQEYICRFGLHDATNGAVTDGVYFEYDRLTSGDVWRCGTSNNSTRTLVATTSAIVANTWYRLKIVVNAAGTSVDFYVDDVLLTDAGLPITTNIPTTVARSCGASGQIIKSAGTTTMNYDMDYAEFRQILTTAR